MRTSSFYIYLFILFCAGSILSCHPRKEIEPPIDARTENQKMKDSIYYYYQLYSLWSDSHIPVYDTPSDFTDQFSDAQQVLSALKAYTPYDSYWQAPIDRFSYINEINPLTGSTLLKDGQNEGFGIYFQLGALDDALAYPIIYFVEGGSPASQQGLRRSDRVTAIDGDGDLAIAVDCTSHGCEVLNQNQYNKVLSLLHSLDQADMIELTVSRNDEEMTYTLHRGVYSVNPLSPALVYSYPDATVGYFSISSFEHLDQQNIVCQSIKTVFDKFELASIDHLVIDLRYNTGGYVETAHHIANKICPPIADKKLMVSYHTNQYLSIPHAHLPSYVSFESIYFERKNQLDIQKIYFLISKQTASAAELLIHILKPYVEVILIGTEDRTYGKPVGFFEQKIMNKVALWISSFEMLNADGHADYWQGMIADKSFVTDYIFRDFGDEEEHMLATAIQHIRNGSFETPASQLPLRSKTSRPKKTIMEKVNSFRSRVAKIEPM